VPATRPCSLASRRLVAGCHVCAEPAAADAAGETVQIRDAETHHRMSFLRHCRTRCCRSGRRAIQRSRYWARTWTPTAATCRALRPTAQAVARGPSQTCCAMCTVITFISAVFAGFSECDVLVHTAYLEVGTKPELFGDTRCTWHQAHPLCDEPPALLHGAARARMFRAAQALRVFPHRECLPEPKPLCSRSFDLRLLASHSGLVFCLVCAKLCVSCSCVATCKPTCRNIREGCVIGCGRVIAVTAASAALPERRQRHSAGDEVRFGQPPCCCCWLPLNRTTSAPSPPA